jgi:hypothetical protein
MLSISLQFNTLTVETATVGTPEKKGLYHANLVAEYDYSERRAALAERVMNCIGRAFHDIGAGPEMQDTIFWNLQMTKDIGLTEIIDEPEEFIAGLQGIYGAAGTAVFEYMLSREIRREFGLDGQGASSVKTRDVCQLLHLVAYAALDQQEAL